MRESVRIANGANNKYQLARLTMNVFCNEFVSVEKECSVIILLL